MHDYIFEGQTSTQRGHWDTHKWPTLIRRQIISHHKQRRHSNFTLLIPNLSLLSILYVTPSLTATFVLICVIMVFKCGMSGCIRMIQVPICTHLREYACHHEGVFSTPPRGTTLYPVKIDACVVKYIGRSRDPTSRIPIISEGGLQSSPLVGARLHIPQLITIRHAERQISQSQQLISATAAIAIRRSRTCCHPTHFVQG